MAAVGLMMMAAPGLLGYGAPADTIHHIAGPVIASLGVVAASAVARPLRRTVLLIGLLVVVSPLLVAQPLTAVLVSLIGGAIAALLALVPVATAGQFGGGWTAVLLPDRLAPEHPADEEVEGRSQR